MEDAILITEDVITTVGGDGQPVDIINNLTSTRTDAALSANMGRDLQEQINAIEPGTGGVTSVNGRAGVVVLTKSDVSLDQVNNTSDASKPVSTAQQAAITSAVGAITPTSLGLGNVNNTSDAAKPVSTAQAAAIALKLDASQKGVANGVVPLGSDSLINSAYLPSYVDDVLEFATLAAFPVTGESGKIYVAINTNLQYRWSGSAYIAISSGAVQSVAGKTGVVTLVASDVGLDQVNNTSDANKPISSATQTALNAKANTSSLALVATTGAYGDLSGKPTIPAAQIQADFGQGTTSSVDYIKNKPKYEVRSTEPSSYTTYPDGSIIIIL